MDQDYFEVLGVPKDASQDDIKKAFHAVSIYCGWLSFFYKMIVLYLNAVW